MTDYQALMTEWYNGILPPKKKRVDAKRANSDEVINNIIAQWAGGSIPSGHPTEPPGENSTAVEAVSDARAESLGMMTMARLGKPLEAHEYNSTLAQVKVAIQAEYAAHKTDMVDFVCSREFVSRFQE